MKNIILLLSLCMVSCVHVSENMWHEAKDMISFSNSNVENNESLFDVRYIKPQQTILVCLELSDK